MAQLPTNQDIIRVISAGGLTKVVRVADCKSCDEVMRLTLRKFGYREDHDRNYCFYVLTGVDPDPNQCRRLQESELWRIIQDQKRPERNRLMLRKIHQGGPGEAEVERAAVYRYGRGRRKPQPSLRECRQAKPTKGSKGSWRELE